jgi:hypothetical protein
MTTPFDDRLWRQEATTDADQIEARAFQLGQAPVDFSAFDEQMAGTLDDVELDAVPRPDWQRNDLQVEATVGPAIEEIERRATVMGEAYPFRRHGNSLQYVGSASLAYEFFLSISLAPDISKNPYLHSGRKFERITAQLVHAHFGLDSIFWHLGAPRDPGHENFRTAFSALQHGTHEWVWNPEEELPDDGGATQDETVDFVIAKQMLDGRAGRLYVVGQCACGNNWRSKIQDPNIDLLGRWFRMPLTSMVKAFSTPFVIADEMLKEVVRENKGLVYDRIRLSILAEKSLEQTIKAEIANAVRPLIANVESMAR